MAIDTESVAIKPQTDYWYRSVTQRATKLLLTPKVGGWPDHVNATAVATGARGVCGPKPCRKLLVLWVVSL